LETLFNVSFDEVIDTSAVNLVSISQNTQADTLGYAFFPNETDPIGSDVFISIDFDTPTSSSSGTNFDYELLLHELFCSSMNKRHSLSLTRTHWRENICCYHLSTKPPRKDVENNAHHAAVTPEHFHNCYSQLFCTSV